jgi:hypothetical protein
MSIARHRAIVMLRSRLIVCRNLLQGNKKLEKFERGKVRGERGAESEEKREERGEKRAESLEHKVYCRLVLLTGDWHCRLLSILQCFILYEDYCFFFVILLQFFIAYGDWIRRTNA